MGTYTALLLSFLEALLLFGKKLRHQNDFPRRLVNRSLHDCGFRIWIREMRELLLHPFYRGGVWKLGTNEIFREKISNFYIALSQSSRRRRWHPTPVLLPGNSHGRRSLVGCSPWGHKESDTTERLHFHFSLSCIGEGNGNPLQCSCLENPREGSLVGCRLWGCTESHTTDVT